MIAWKLVAVLCVLAAPAMAQCTAMDRTKYSGGDCPADSPPSPAPPPPSRCEGCLPGEQAGDYPDPPKGMSLYDTTRDTNYCMATGENRPRGSVDYASFMCFYVDRTKGGMAQNAIDKCQNVVTQVWCSLDDCERDLRQKGLVDHIGCNRIKTTFFCASRSGGGAWQRAD